MRESLSHALLANRQRLNIKNFPGIKALFILVLDVNAKRKCKYHRHEGELMPFFSDA